MVNREQEIFCAALERTAEGERATFLDAACAGDPAARARIEALLRAANDAGGFLDDTHAPVREAAGSQIGRYRLLEKIGEGGFGVVYLAEQDEPVRRTVALKIIKLGMDTRAVVARFEAERQALALMEHSNIAHVFDAGATETGRPYFVMELVRGTPITAFCNDHRLGVRERLELFQQVCRAIHHAHQKGIIHRDLKPTNILVTLDGERPVVKVIDFGIAKATREPLTAVTLATRLHVFMGTPAYMSPEQIGDNGTDVDTRSDIYSLGALLYELLADVPALDAKKLLAAGYAEVQSAIQNFEPLPPSARFAAFDETSKLLAANRRRTTPARLTAALRGDLDRIVQKCLEKDRTRRYETTDELARDLARYLRHEPVLARPATLAYRATKFFQRRRRSVLATAAALVALATLGVYHAHRLATERDRARLEAQKAAKASSLLVDLLTAADPFATRAGTEKSPVGSYDASAERVRREFSDQPELRAEIFNAIGRVYLRTGQHEQAQAILLEALAAGRAMAKPDARLAQTLSDLGVLRRERGNFQGALTAFEEALSLRLKIWGNDHNDVAITLVELARLYSALDQLPRAETLSREALAIRQRVLGPEHREIGTSLGDLAVVLWQQGKLTEAEQVFGQSLAMHRKTLGPEHANVAVSLSNLAQLKLDQGDLATAEQLLREAHAMAKKSMGEKHWRTARVLGSLAGAWTRQGRHSEAAAALDEARQIARTALGPENPVVVNLIIERARVHLAVGEPAAAEVLLHEALRVQLRSQDVGSWRVASTKSLLGAALIGQSRTAEAEALLLEADRVLKEIPGPQGRETKPTRERLAALTANHRRD